MSRAKRRRPTQPPPAPERTRAMKQAQIAWAANRAGHELRTGTDQGKIRLTCSCGWSTHLNWARKRVFGDAQQHIIDVGRAQLAEDERIADSVIGVSDRELSDPQARVRAITEPGRG